MENQMSNPQNKPVQTETESDPFSGSKLFSDLKQATS